MVSIENNQDKDTTLSLDIEYTDNGLEFMIHVNKTYDYGWDSVYFTLSVTEWNQLIADVNKEINSK